MWAVNYFTWFFTTLFGKAIWETTSKAWTFLFAGGALILMRTKPDLMVAAVKEVNDEILTFNPIAVKLSAETLKQIAGLEVNSAELEEVIKAPPGRNATIGIGDAFLPILNGIFDLNAARGDFSTRTGFAGSAANMSAFFGTNLTFQLRSLTISTISSMFGFHSLRHLEGLHQSINWAFGFGWLSWAVMSNVMDVAVTPGMKRYYNSQVKTHDFTEAQAINAYTRGLITDEVFNQILDNEGIRNDIRGDLVEMHRQEFSVSQAHQAYLAGRIDNTRWDGALTAHSVKADIRKVQLDMAEAEFTTSDLKWLYSHGYLTHEQVVQNLRWTGYRSERAELKAKVLEAETRTPKRDREVEALRHLYRDCVIDEIEFRQEMNSRGTASEEQEHQVTLALIERRQRTFLGNADLAKAAALGLRTIPEITNQLICRGYTQDDALTEVILRLAALLPSCEGKSLKEAELVTVLSALAQTLGANPIGVSAAISSFLSCLLPASGIAAPIVTKFKATPEVVGFDGYSLLEWDVIGATHVTISHIGEVPNKGSTLYNLKEPIGFVLTAKNPFGTATESAFVKVDIDMTSAVLPMLTSISPNSGPAKGGTVVTLTGSGFTGAFAVNFGFGTGVGLQVDSDTQITVTTPSGSGLVDVKVLTPGGISATGQDLTFTYS